jgi:catecholate siderophore receptor
LYQSLGPIAGSPRRIAVAVSLALAAASAQGAETSVLPKISVEEKAEVINKAEVSNKVDESSSPKFTQPLLDTPQTIAIISSAVLQEQRARTLSQALRNTPGVTFLLGENGNTATGDSIFMRGFDTQSSIFVDGIRDLGTISRDTFNTEQVEVAKGPSGPDNGRGAASGYVNLSSKVPVADDFARTSASYGTADWGRLTGDFNHQFADAPLAFRLNVMGEDGGVAGRDEVEQRSWAVAPSIVWGLGQDTRVHAFFLHTEQDNRPDGGIPTIGLNGFFNSFVPAEARAPDSDNFYGSLSDFEDVEANMATVRFEHDFSDAVRLRNTSRYGKSEQFYVLTGVGPINATSGPLNFLPGSAPSTWTVPRTRQAKFQENTIITNQTNLTATLQTGTIEHAITSGLEYIDEKQYIPAYEPTGLGAMPAANLYNPNPRDPVGGRTLVRSGAFSEGQTETIGAYVFDTLTLSEHWEVTAGFRVDNYDTDFEQIAATTFIRTRLTDSDTLFAYKVGVLYKPAPNGSVYLSHAISQQPPGGTNFTLSTTLATNNANDPNLSPQKATNLELGTKWDLMEGALAVTAAIFRSTNENEMAVDRVDQTIRQIGERRVEGIELGIVGEVVEGWELSAGIAKMDTEISEGPANQAGQQIVWSPDLTFTSWTTYNTPFGLTIGGGVSYTDSVSRTSASNVIPGADTANLVEAPDYWIIDAMIAYEFNERFSVQLNGYNLADDDYAGSLNNSGARYKPGNPRSALLSVDVNF